jgi:hypothetical protein
MRRTASEVLASLVLAFGLATGAGGAEAGAPANCDVMMTLEKASWFAGERDKTRDVYLRLRRLDGNWVPVFAGNTVRGPNSTHMGFVTAGQSGADGESLTLRVHLLPDPWIGGEAEAGYKVRFAVEGGQCKGTWTGVVHGVECSGGLSGQVEALRSMPGYKPPAFREHPRLLIRKADLPALRARAETPRCAEVMKQLQADKGLMAQAFVYALTGDKACAGAVQEKILKGIEGQQWFHIGVAHASAFIVAEHMMAYDLIYDACDEAFHQRIRDALSDKLDFYYWGAQNSQFNPNDTSNWSLMYRSGLGQMAMTAMDLPPEPLPAVQKEIARLKPPAELKVGAGVPVVTVSMDKPIDSWIFAGPVDEGLRDDAFREAGGVAAARPEVGAKAGNCVFQALTEESINEGNVNLAALTKRKYLKGCYLYCVLDVPKAGCYRLQSMTRGKGVRHRVFYLDGHRMDADDFVYLEKGRYPLMVRIFTEPVGNWEPLSFWAGLVLSPEDQALAWQAARAGGPAADAFCGANWREEIHKKTGWNPEAWGYAQMAAHKAEKYFTRGLGEHGWNQEGEAYTRHSLHLAMPFAHCYRNMFGADIRGADRTGMMLALATAQTVFADDSARMQSFNVGGGPMDVSLFARGFSFVPAEFQPAVLWAWNRTEALCKTGKFKDPHGPVAGYDGLSKVMLFLNWPLEAKEQDPAAIMPRVTVDRQKGGYVFRNQWKDADDCVAQLFANSNQAGGSWASCEGGTFRLDGLGASWAVRGQSYGNGASARRLPDYSLYQNMVDVGGHNIGGSPQARTTHCALEKDGSGVVSLNLDEIYTTIENKERKDLGIRAVRSLGVDYSGQSGVPCLVAVADRLTGTQGSNVWQLATEREHAVACSDNTFTITAKNGATLKGTVLKPAGASARTVDYEHVHEVNYHGGHGQKTFLRRAILVDGRDKDQDFLVLMTLQKGEAPPVKPGADGLSASVGRRKVRFDGAKIVME